MQAKVHKTIAHIAHIAHHGRDGASSHAALELNPAGEILALQSSEHMHLPQARGWTVRALAGTVWIAQDGDIRDVVLEAGDCIVLDRATPALFSPLGDARIHLSRETGRRTSSRFAIARPAAGRAAFS